MKDQDKLDLTDLTKVNLKILASLTTKDLLAFYNAHAEKPIARFADHPSGFRRAKALFDSLLTSRTAQVEPAPADRTVAHRSEEDRRQSARNKVLVAPVSKPTATKEYHSVLAAFKALGLPIVKHQRFRRQVKINGKATFAEFIFTATYK